MRFEELSVCALTDCKSSDLVLPTIFTPQRSKLLNLVVALHAFESDKYVAWGSDIICHVLAFAGSILVPPPPCLEPQPDNGVVPFEFHFRDELLSLMPVFLLERDRSLLVLHAVDPTRVRAVPEH